MAYEQQRALIAELLQQRMIPDVAASKILKIAPFWSEAAHEAAAQLIALGRSKIDGAGIDVSCLAERVAQESVKTTRSIYVNAGSIYICHEWNDKLTAVVKDTFHPTWCKDIKSWRIVPSDVATYISALRHAEKYGYQVQPGVIDAALTHGVAIKQTIAASLAADADFDVAGLGGVLRPFQRAGVQYVVQHAGGRALIADEMGLGKTVEALASVQSLNAFPVVVVCPSFLKTNWRREALKWLPDKAVTVVKNGKDEIKVADVVIISYDVVEKQIGALSRLNAKSLICDESHYLKNYKAKRTVAVSEFAKGMPVRLLLTGTPIVNRPSELISQLNILHRLNDIGGFWHFAKRYCGGERGLDGAYNLGELREKLRATCYLRREKKDVLTELPPIQRNVVSVEIDNRREYDKAVRDIVTYVAESKARQAAFSTAAKGMTDSQRRELAARVAYEAVESTQRAETLVRIEKLRQIAANGKVAAIKEWIEEFAESGKKLVVFATHQEIVDAIAAHFPACVKITGAESKEARQAAVDRFQSNPQVKLAICTFKAASVGLTLTAAADVLSVELAWTSVDHDQAEARCHRIGQTADSINHYFLVADDTIDDFIFELIERKRGIIDDVNSIENIDGVSTVLASLLAKSGIDTKKLQKSVSAEFKAAAKVVVAETAVAA